MGMFKIVRFKDPGLQGDIEHLLRKAALTLRNFVIAYLFSVVD